MGNILDYLRLRGGYPLARVPFGEVDNLVLSELSALRWERLTQPGEALSLRELQARVGHEPISRGITAIDDARLLLLAAASDRFGEAVLCEYTHESDEAIGKQFAAATFLLPDGTAFVSFRGTDGTVVGWKEDFHMAFSAPVPSQERAVEYLRQAAESHPRPLRTGGHSKGGNLALYAAALAPVAVQERLLAVYCNDSPGLSDEIVVGEGFARIRPKLFSFVPQSSLFGMLLTHPETYAVVYSNSISVFQHNPYTWQVEDAAFVKEKELRRGSQYAEQVLHRWLAGLSEKQRRDFVDTLFQLVEATKTESFGLAVVQNALRNPGAVWEALRGIDPETRVGLLRTLGSLVRAAVQYEQEHTPKGDEPHLPADPGRAPDA